MWRTWTPLRAAKAARARPTLTRNSKRCTLAARRVQVSAVCARVGMGAAAHAQHGTRTHPPCGCARAEVRDLSAGFRFKFRVSALNKQGASQWSRISILETAPGMPQAPDAAIVASVASDSLQLVWPPALGQGAPVSVYVVQMGQPACVTPAPRASSEAPTSSSSTDEGAGGGEGGRAEPAEVPAPASAAGDAATNGAKPEPAAEGHSEATTRSPVATTNFKTIYSGPAPSCTGEPPSDARPCRRPARCDALPLSLSPQCPGLSRSPSMLFEFGRAALWAAALGAQS